MQLSNKTILIISPQDWGIMHLAKHHYAIELAKHNNEVYFLNPANESQRGKTRINIVKSEYENLFLINHSVLVSYKVKFKLKSLFHYLMKLHIKKIEKAIGKKIDIVWSFDLGNFYPFRFFSNTSYKIFNPVDEPLYKDGIESAKDCNIIISITREILLNYNNYNVPKHFIHHGLGEDFIDAHKQIKIDNKIRFGFSGNLLRQDIDTATFLKIVQENPEIIFECWGSYQTKQTNIGGESNLATDNFITQLTSCNNAILHGPVHPSKLANEFRRMDGFIICYDILKDQSKGTNYHKVMEYLSTGKVIVSNNITTYQQIPNLLEMNDSRNDNNNLPNLFKKVAENLDYYNQQSFQQLRIEFAMSNLYSKKIKEIENILQ